MQVYRKPGHLRSHLAQAEQASTLQPCVVQLRSAVRSGLPTLHAMLLLAMRRRPTKQQSAGRPSWCNKSRVSSCTTGLDQARRQRCVSTSCTLSQPRFKPFFSPLSGVPVQQCAHYLLAYILKCKSRGPVSCCPHTPDVSQHRGASRPDLPARCAPPQNSLPFLHLVMAC